MKQHRYGMALLEVLIALTIFSIAALSAAMWVRQVELTVEQVNASAEEIRRASRYLDLLALWPREDLDRHLGNRRQGEWVICIQRPFRTIYEVLVLDSTAQRTLLRTSLYRAEIATSRQ